MRTFERMSARLRGIGRGLGRATLAVVAAVGMTVWAAACGEDTTKPDQNAVSTVALNTATLTIATGEQATLQATARSAGGNEVNATFIWSSSDPTVANVSGVGLVTGVSFGNATITATAAGKSASAAVVVTPAGTIVDASGGVVQSADGMVTLTIPAGALDDAIDVVITRVNGADPGYLGGIGYRIDPAQIRLRTRAQLQMRFDPAQLPAGVYQEQLRIRDRDRDQDCEHLGLQGQMVMATIEAFGMFGIEVQAPAGTMIGPEGGTVVSADGNVTLVIPAGALDAPTDVSIVPADDGQFSHDPMYVDATAYEIRPADVELNGMAQLRIGFVTGNMPDNVSVQQLRIRERERVQNQWRDCSHLGVQSNAVTAEVEHFGVFAVVASTQAPPSAAKAISVSPTFLEMEEGDVVQMTAVVTDASGAVIDAAVTWTTSDASIATVDATGLVTAVAEGTAKISAAAGAAKGGAPVNVNKKGQKPGSVTLSPSSASVPVGQTVQLTATVLDQDGNVITRTLTWATSDPAIATVNASGLVTGVAAGTATITATVQTVSGSATVTVTGSGGGGGGGGTTYTVTIAGISSSPLEIGGTVQLTATVTDATGQVVNVTVSWTTSDANIATVDATGLVTAIGPGTATITATAGTGTASVSVRVVGESTETGNNMSWPVVFADGIGLLGSAVATDPGVRPLFAEGITVDVLPFFWSGNVADCDVYYCQGGPNTWRAEYIDGAGQPAYDASAYWGDNLSSQKLSATKPIRVEVALSATGVGTLKGFNMPYVLYPSSKDEIQGTDGTTTDLVPLIYTVGPTLTVEKLSGPGGSVTATVSSGEMTAEMNVGGRIVYGGQLKLDAYGAGTYRLRYTLASGANVRITAVGNTTGNATVVSPSETAIEITVQ